MLGNKLRRVGVKYYKNKQTNKSQKNKQQKEEEKTQGEKNLSTLSKAYNIKKGEQRVKCRILSRVNNCLTGKKKKSKSQINKRTIFYSAFHFAQEFSLNFYPFSKAQLTICFMQVK